MDFFRVSGSRRSVRYFDPDRAVERYKIETIGHATRLASRAMNVPWGKGVVVYRNSLTDEERNGLKTPFAGVEFDLAPVYLFWYSDLAAREDALQGVHYPTVPSGALQDTAVYGPPHGWSQRYVERVVVPQVLMPGLGNRVRGGNADTAMALMQGYLAAVDEGLGACLVPFDEEGARRIVDVPQDIEPAAALLIGYAAESTEAGGQRPHGAWDESFFNGDTNTPYPRDAEVTARLEAEGLLQTPAPLPWRRDEVRALSRGLGLAGGRVETPSGEVPEGAPVNLGPIRDYASVGEWRKGVSKFWRTPPPDDWLGRWKHSAASPAPIPTRSSTRFYRRNPRAKACDFVPGRGTNGWS